MIAFAELETGQARVTPASPVPSALLARRIAGSSPRATRVRRAGRLVAAGLDHLDDGAVRSPEAQRRRAGLGENLSAMAADDIGEGFPVGDLEAPVMDARAGA